MTRIIAGDAGSLRLMSPDKVTRPTSDRVREAIFSRLETLTEIRGAHVLDLFAGTGALGLEAASRGASAVWLVDHHAGAQKVISANTAVVQKALSHSASIRSIKSTVSGFLESTPTGKISIVLMDPPYDYPVEHVNRHLIDLVPWLATGALIALERASQGPAPLFPAEYEALGQKSYGDTVIYWARIQKGSQPPL
jgi:16S rRNA (guanine966-N2)-methyltransferase